MNSGGGTYCSRDKSQGKAYDQSKSESGGLTFFVALRVHGQSSAPRAGVHTRWSGFV